MKLSTFSNHQQGGLMFPFVDQKIIDQFSKQPTAFAGKFLEFQRAGMAAFTEIFENGNRALVKLAAIRDPQALFTAQQSILQDVAQQNIVVLSRVGQSWAEEVKTAAKDAVAVVAKDGAAKAA
jgi:hypothetical protein